MTQGPKPPVVTFLLEALRQAILNAGLMQIYHYVGVARWMLGVVVIGSVAACSEGLGECDSSSSVSTVVYDDATGLPAYAAQAVMHASCGNGAFCHSQQASQGDRFGVPRGMDFDLLTVQSCLANTEECRATEETERLREGLFETFDRRDDVWSAIDGETMPPGAKGKELATSAMNYSYENGTPVPSIFTKEGKEIVRNWLACSPPLEIVERTFPHPDATHKAIGAVVPQKVVDAPDPTWSSIYEKAFAQRCATASCHNASDHVADLDMSSAELAYAALVDKDAASTGGGVCGNSGLKRVKKGEPDNSLLIQKLEQTQTCGSPMPIGSSMLTSTFIEPIRQWIADGALDN